MLDGTAEYSYETPCLLQVPQVGSLSSHFTLRLRHALEDSGGLDHTQGAGYAITKHPLGLFNDIRVPTLTKNQVTRCYPRSLEPTRPIHAPSACYAPCSRLREMAYSSFFKRHLASVGCMIYFTLQQLLDIHNPRQRSCISNERHTLKFLIGLFLYITTVSGTSEIK
jgi:hypothetical protein